MVIELQIFLSIYLKSKLSKFCSKNITFKNNRNVIAFVTNLILKYSIQIDRISLF